jgi:hypothetical protein
MFTFVLSNLKRYNIMEAIKTYELPNNRTLKVFQDDSNDSPRSWDNLSKMIFIGSHSRLGDNHDFHDSHESFEAHQADIEKQLDIAIILPVYAYIHSGMTISLSPFSCRWDSGKLGWVVVTKQAIRENWNIKNVTKKYIEMAMNIVEGEIETLDQYIRGDVYGFQVCDENDNVEDSCWGFYGDDIKENGILDHLSKEDIEFINQVELV